MAIYCSDLHLKLRIAHRGGGPDLYLVLSITETNTTDTRPSPCGLVRVQPSQLRAACVSKGGKCTPYDANGIFFIYRMFCTGNRTPPNLNSTEHRVRQFPIQVGSSDGFTFEWPLPSQSYRISCSPSPQKALVVEARASPWQSRPIEVLEAASLSIYRSALCFWGSFGTARRIANGDNASISIVWFLLRKRFRRNRGTRFDQRGGRWQTVGIAYRHRRYPSG